MFFAYCKRLKIDREISFCYITECLKKVWKNCVYYPWKQIVDKTKSMTTISPTWMISAALPWDSQDTEIAKIWWRDKISGHMSHVRVHMTDVYKQLCSWHGQECIVLRFFLNFITLTLYFFVNMFPSWWFLKKFCIILMFWMWKVIESFMLLIRIIV